MTIGNAIAVLAAQSAFCAPTHVSLPDSALMASLVTYNELPYTAALRNKNDVPGLGVAFDVGIGGFGQTRVRLGTPSPHSDLSGYDFYSLSFTNTGPNDHYFVSVYIKTGLGNTLYESRLEPLMPGNSVKMSLDLSTAPTGSDLTDVREMGFGLFAYIGQGFGLADEFKLNVVGQDGDPVPEASTLMLFGSGLAGVLAVMRKRLPFLSK